MKRKALVLAIAAASGGTTSAALAQQVPSNRPIEVVVVYGTQGTGAAETGSRLGLTLLETPATVDVIDGNAIRARVDTSVIEAVTRSAGFTSESDPGNGHSSIAARGFRGQGTVTKLYDGMNYFTAAGTITFPFDTWSTERIEVLKGPASVLYGEGGIGGAINVIPRQPQFERSSDLRLIMGEDDTSFVGIDTTGPISDSMAYRLDYSRSQSDNWIRNSESDAEMFSFALRWDVSPDVAISARYDYGDQEPMKYFGAPLANFGFLDLLTEQNFNVADAEIRYQDDAVRLRADWRISDTLDLQTEVFRLSTDRFWKNTEYYSYDAVSQTVDRFDPLVIGHDMDHNGIRASLSIEPMDRRIKTSIGIEVNDISFLRPTNFGPANPDPIDFGNDFDTVSAIDFQPGTLLDLTDAPVLLDNMSDVSQIALFGEAQFYLSDRLSLVGALRYDDYQTDYVRLGQAPIDQAVDVVTGRIGTVFDLNDQTVLYAQYGTGATHPSNSVVTASPSNREADMIESEQVEVGLKHQVGGTGLQWTVALFDITKNNLIEDDPNSSDPNDLIVIPEQTSQGIEVGYNYAVTPSFQIYGSVATLNAETNTGATPNYVPEETANLGFAWNSGGGFRVIADVRHVGDRFEATWPIPSYTVVDASVHWPLEDNIGLTVKAENLLDEEYATTAYYEDTWLLGRLRTLSLVADFRF